MGPVELPKKYEPPPSQSEATMQAAICSVVNVTVNVGELFVKLSSRAPVAMIEPESENVSA